MRFLQRSLGGIVKRHWQVGVVLLGMVILDRAGWLPRLVPRELPTQAPQTNGSPYEWLILITLLLALVEWLRRAWWETH